MKLTYTIVLLLAAGVANAQSTPPVPAITSALNDGSTVAAAPLTTGTAAATAPVTPTAAAPVIPAPIQYEDVSPRVARARGDFDNKQRTQVAEYVTGARQAPSSSSTFNKGGATIFSYRPGGIYTVYVGVGRITVVTLQPGEQITGEVQGGDTVRWMIAQVNNGSDAGEQTNIVLKVTDAGLSTNIFIPTNRRTYMIDARSVADWYMPSVSWEYPQDTWKQQQIASAKRASVEPVGAAPDALRFNYDISGRKNYGWRPMQVFDDGAQTYIRMPATLNATDAPALFIIEKGEPLLVNYRVKGVADGATGPTYIVDRIFDRAELRVGVKQTITIRRR